MPADRAARPLIRRVVTALTLAIGCGALLSALAGGEVERRTLVAIADDELVSLGEILAYEVVRSYELTDERGLAGFLDGVVRRRPALEYLAIAGADGKVVASTQADEVGKPLGPNAAGVSRTVSLAKTFCGLPWRTIGPAVTVS